MTKRDWGMRAIQTALTMSIGLLLFFSFALGHCQAPYVNLTGQMKGPNGLPLSNNILNFTPSQLFFLPGTNTTQPIDSIFGPGAPTGACAVEGQFYTNTTPTPNVLYQCQFGAWVGPLGPSPSVTGNPRPVYNVVDYGAVGDCTGSGSFTTGNVFAPGTPCTNNHNAIQSAVNAAYITGGSVYYPTNPNVTSGQTVYYTATSVNPKGVSMYGPPSGSGPTLYYVNQMPVSVRGGVGQDVFAVTDPSDAGYVIPLVAPQYRDFAVLVDDSTDASINFPYRKPGRICWDVGSVGGTTITSAAQCEFQPGDVGQAITVGATTTTISTYISPTSVTVGTTIGAATSIHTYIGVMGLPVTQNIGNCGFAYPDRAGIASGVSIDKAEFSNLVVQGISAAIAQNYSCGFFFQGNNAPVQSEWSNSSVGATFPFAYVQENTVAPTSLIWTGLGDVNVWDHLWLYGEYPFLAYSGNYGTIRAMQISGALYGPHILLAYGVNGYLHGWSIDIPEQETLSSLCGSPYTAFRITGRAQKVTQLSMGLCSANNGALQWDASGSSANIDGTGIGPFNIAGDDNTFTIPNSADNITSTATFNDTGRGNTLVTGSLSNPYGGSQPGRRQYAGGFAGNTATFGPALLSHGGLAFDRRSDFINVGATLPFFNAQDLWVWPSEIFHHAGYFFYPINDSTSESGQYLPTISGTNQYLNGSNAHDWFIGSQVPAGKLRVYVKIASAASTSTWTVYAQALESSTWTTLNSANFTGVGTTYQTSSFDADATGLTGDQFRLIVVSATQAGKLAWTAVRPWGDTLSTGITVGAGTSTIYRCTSGADDGLMVWKASVCTGAGGTTTSTVITTP